MSTETHYEMGVGPPRFELGSNAPEAPSIGQANPRALRVCESQIAD